MKLEYEEWKKLNPDQDFSQKEYQQAVLNMHAFEYQSIKDQEQANKEFWGQIISLVVIVGATFIFPPAGIALGAVYGTLELSSAVSGKDWISGRELDTTERWVRGVLAPLDIIPGRCRGNEICRCRCNWTSTHRRKSSTNRFKDRCEVKGSKRV